MLMATIVVLLATSLSFPLNEWNRGVCVVLLFGRRFEMNRMATVQGEIGGKKMSSQLDETVECFHEATSHLMISVCECGVR